MNTTLERTDVQSVQTAIRVVGQIEFRTFDIDGDPVIWRLQDDGLTRFTVVSERRAELNRLLFDSIDSESFEDGYVLLKKSIPFTPDKRCEDWIQALAKWRDMFGTWKSSADFRTV